MSSAVGLALPPRTACRAEAAPVSRAAQSCAMNSGSCFCLWATAWLTQQASYETSITDAYAQRLLSACSTHRPSPAEWRQQHASLQGRDHTVFSASNFNGQGGRVEGLLCVLYSSTKPPNW